MEIALDTNAYSEWVRHGRWTKVISSADWVGIPVVVLGELLKGTQPKIPPPRRALPW